MASDPRRLFTGRQKVAETESIRETFRGNGKLQNVQGRGFAQHMVHGNIQADTRHAIARLSV